VASASRRWFAGASRPCVPRARRPRQTMGKMPMLQNCSPVRRPFKITKWHRHLADGGRTKRGIGVPPMVRRGVPPLRDTGETPASDHGQDAHATAARVRPWARCPCHGSPRQTTGKMPMPQQPASDHWQDANGTILHRTARRPTKWFSVQRHGTIVKRKPASAGDAFR
jgi:hypothetical protein